MRRTSSVLLCAALALAALPAGAERADRDKPVNIESDRLSADDAKQVAVFEGRVVLTQGTFVLRSDKLTVRQDKEGFSFAIANGNPATFRQKHDSVDEWVDGEALRIEYDGKKDFVELFDKARLTRDKDEVRGNYISYDSKTEFFRVQGGKDFVPSPDRDGRVRAIIQPKPKDDKGAPAAPALQLKSAPAPESPRPR
jgi:lipopolysaccharide export system protein LptA